MINFNTTARRKIMLVTYMYIRHIALFSLSLLAFSIHIIFKHVNKVVFSPYLMITRHLL